MFARRQQRHRNIIPHGRHGATRVVWVERPAHEPRIFLGLGNAPPDGGHSVRRGDVIPVDAAQGAVLRVEGGAGRVLPVPGVEAVVY
jgi:hypothetical protein